MRYHRTFGLNAEQLDELEVRIEDILSEPWDKGIGRPKCLSLREAIMVTLLYERQNMIEEVIADLYGVSQATVSDIITDFTPLIAQATEEFRLDATLPAGVRSFIVSNGTGSLRELDGTTTPIPYYQAVNFGSSVVFPLVHLLAALLNTSTNITYQGLVTRAGHQVHDIRVQGLSAPAATTAGVQANIPAQDFFIDSSTFQVISTLGKAYPKDGSLSAAPAEVQFSDYRQVNGILLPFAVTTLIAGQSASAIQLNQVTFNNNLTDSDFRP